MKATADMISNLGDTPTMKQIKKYSKALQLLTIGK